MRQFKQTTVKANIQGKEVELTRHELLLHKAYENAMNGSVLSQRKLLDRFEQSDDTFAEARFLIKWLGEKLIEQHEETGRMEPKDYEEFDYFYRLVHGRHFHEADNDPPPRSRKRWRQEGDAPTWPTGPKPQAILDLEKEWAEAEAAEQAERAKSKGSEPDDA